MLSLTKRTATLSQKTRIQLPKLCQSKLIRLYVQLRGNAMEHNGVFAGQNRKLETHGYIFFFPQGAQQLLARKSTKPPQNGNGCYFCPSPPPLGTTLHRPASETALPFSARAPGRPAAAATSPAPGLLRSPIPAHSVAGGRAGPRANLRGRPAMGAELRCAQLSWEPT